jgi:hypothetical protein
MLDQLFIHQFSSGFIALASIVFLCILAYATLYTKSMVASRLRWATVFLFAGIAALNVYRAWVFIFEAPTTIRELSTAIDLFRFATFMVFWWAWATVRPTLDKTKPTPV